MILGDLVMRIRAGCPIFENRVYGSAEIEEGIRQAEKLPVPTAFVMVDGDFPQENVDAAAVQQLTQERWTVVVVVENKNDARGQMAGNQLHSARRQLMGALLGWENVKDEDTPVGQEPASDWGPIVYRGGLHISMNASRLWHQFSFGHNIILQAGRDYECIQDLKLHFRGGPTGGDNTAEPFYHGPTNDSSEQPAIVPPHLNPDPDPFPNPADPEAYLKYNG